MKCFISSFLTLCFINILFSQNTDVYTVDKLPLLQLEKGKLHRFWLSLGEDHLSTPIKIPVLIAKGLENGPVLGLTAAIHGNELNGIAVIHELFENLNPKNLKGTIIAIAGLNPLGIASYQREFVDGTDLNRIFPGKENGNRSEQMAYHIGKKIIPFFDYHVDLHTASFGRINSLYGRGDMENDTLAGMLRALAPDIIVSNKGKASFGSASGLTMRAFATAKGIPSITVEYGNPQVYQKEMIKRGVDGLQNLMVHLGFLEEAIQPSKESKVCAKSYWLYTDKGGYLDIVVDLKQEVKQNDVIAILKNSFGAIIATYKVPEDGIVVGKSTNPVSSSGSRIIHLGILKQ